MERYKEDILSAIEKIDNPFILKKILSYIMAVIEKDRE